MKTFLVLLLAAPSTAFVRSPATRGCLRPSVILSVARTDADEPPFASDSSVVDRRAALAYSLSTAALLSSPIAATAIETYLTEPTDEFKESERQRMEFRKRQLLLKGDFVAVLARLTGESKTEEELVRDLEELRGLVVKTGGLPLGIKKDEMYKVIRSKKAKGFWPTNVEIAYQGLKSEVAYQQSPNTEKDLENPL